MQECGEMGTHTLIAEVHMGLATLERNWEIFSSSQDANNVQPRISTFMRITAETCTQVHKKFCPQCDQNIIYSNNESREKNQVLSIQKWLNAYNYASEHYIAFKMKRTCTAF